MKLFSLAIVALVFVLVLSGAGFIIRMGVADAHSNSRMIKSYLRPKDSIAVKTAVEVAVPTPATVSAKVDSECNPSGSLDKYLKQNNIDSSFSSRLKLSKVYEIENYKGTSAQNASLLRAMQCKERNAQ